MLFKTETTIEMMNSKNGEMMIMPMMENHEAMMKMMKDNPGMMDNMMMNMMEACKTDTTMMAGMCKMDMMGEKMNMNTGEMDSKMKH